jgi:hypothetical protein
MVNLSQISNQLEPTNYSNNYLLIWGYKMKDYKNSKVKDNVYECIVIGFCFIAVVLMSAFIYLLLGV